MILNLSKKSLFLYFFLIISLFIGLLYGEDSGGGGSIVDFEKTWILIEKPFELESFIYDFKFPLHYYIGGLVYKISDSVFFVKVFYVILTCFLPLIFYRCLELKFPYINKNSLFILSLILLLLPGVRAAAIWPNTQITGVFFFMFSAYNFLKLEQQNNFTKISKHLILTLLFMALAVYSRQIYALIYLYLVFVFFRKYSLKNFIKLSSIIFLLSIPGLIGVFMVPSTLTLTFDSNLQNSLLVNFSIISFYLIPVFFLACITQNIQFSAGKDLILFTFASAIFVIMLSYFFDYNFKLGGGVLMKVSLLLTKNFYLFFLTSFTGLVLLFWLCANKINNIILSLIIPIGISAYMIPQKYFEPMMFILIFLIYNNKVLELILKKKRNIYLLFSFYSLYLIAAVINMIYKIKENYILNL